MADIVGNGIICDRCGDIVVMDGLIIQGYSLLEVEHNPKYQHYLCAMCYEEWKGFYLLSGWQVKQEILIIEPN